MASFARVETWTHPCVCFQNSASVIPQPPDISLPHQVPPSCAYEGVCWGGGSARWCGVETRDRQRCLEGVLKLYLKRFFIYINKRKMGGVEALGLIGSGRWSGEEREI